MPNETPLAEEPSSTPESITEAERLLARFSNDRREADTARAMHLPVDADLTLSAAQALYERYRGRDDDEAMHAMVRIAHQARRNTREWALLHCLATRALGSYLIENGRGRGRPKKYGEPHNYRLTLTELGIRDGHDATDAKKVAGIAQEEFDAYLAETEVPTVAELIRRYVSPLGSDTSRCGAHKGYEPPPAPGSKPKNEGGRSRSKRLDKSVPELIEEAGVAIHPVAWSRMRSRGWGQGPRGRWDQRIPVIGERWNPQYISDTVATISAWIGGADRTRITCSDFEPLIADTSRSAVLFIDSPYFGEKNLYRYDFKDDDTADTS
jgi:hypothetical protein